ncbi:MAG: hypothetical protein JST67_00005 [Bacteroidetes bacterium]|nr:hypothetical protein [Bacteroidota bacterium]
MALSKNPISVQPAFAPVSSFPKPIPLPAGMSNNAMQGIQALATAIAAGNAQLISDQNTAIADYTASVNESKAIFKIPQLIKVSLHSTHSANAQATNVTFFNEDSYTPCPTDNTTGKTAPGSLSCNYGDGRFGKFYNQLFRSVNGGQGLLVYGFNVQCKDGNGNDDPAQLSALNITINDEDGNGNQIPTIIDLADAARNNQFKSGLYTVKSRFFLTSLNQIKLTMLGDNVVDHNVILAFRTTPYAEDVK